MDFVSIVTCRPQTKFANVMFLHLSVILSTGGHAWWGAVHGRGVCLARGHAWWGGMHGRGCAWQGPCMVGGHAWQGVCMAGGCSWQGCIRGTACMAGGMHATHASPPDTTRYGRSMRGRYVSYWNAFLFFGFLHYIWTNCYWLLISHTYSEVTHTHTHTEDIHTHTYHPTHTHAHRRTHTADEKWTIRYVWLESSGISKFITNRLTVSMTTRRYTGSHLSWDPLQRRPGYKFRC